MAENNFLSSGYSVLAPVYDKLNDTVDYSKWADFISKLFDKFSPDKKIVSVLDLGCGTGSMTIELARRGYDMTALDISDEMLSVASSRAREYGLEGILFIESDMCDFELYGTVDAIVCCLDGINHLTTRNELTECFSLVNNYLEPDGLFVFDVNTPYRFKTMYADRDYILEDEGIMCCWRNRLNKKGDAVDFFLTVFEEKNGEWIRSDGAQRERAYSLRTLKNALAECGFELLDVSADYDFNKPNDETVRWYITAKNIKPKAGME